jgi:hypothetical protein
LWIKAAWSALGGGYIVDIRQVDRHRVVPYLSKYVTDDLRKVPAGTRRVSTSRTILLFDKTTPTTAKWRLDKRSIFLLLKVFRPVAYELQQDYDGFLFSFLVPAGSEIPPWKGDP